LRERGVYWAPKAFSEESRNSLLDLAQSRFQKGEFRPARIGKGSRKQRIEAVRGDCISWIDSWQAPSLEEVKRLFDEIMHLGQKELFLALKGYEAHFSHYPIGEFRHLTLPPAGDLVLATFGSLLHEVSVMAMI